MRAGRCRRWARTDEPRPRHRRGVGISLLRRAGLSAIAALLVAGAVFARPAVATGVAGQWDEERYYVERAYRQALLVWSSGEPAAVAEAVAAYSQAQQHGARFVHGLTLELEEMELRQYVSGEGSEIVSILPDLPMRCALSAELHTIELLERRSRDHLLALAIFHFEVYLHQMTREPLPWLEKENRKRMAELLDRYLEIVEREFEGAERDRRLRWLYDAWMVAGTTQVALGWGLPLERSLRAFGRARLAVPDGLEAPYWTALVFEKLGRHSPALRELRRLAKSHPGSPDISLRHAIQLRRRGRDRAAAKALRALIDGAAPDRFRILAYQELASLRAERAKHWSDAVALLRQGIDEFPHNERLQIQLSFLLGDRALSGDVEAEAAAVLLAESEQIAESLHEAVAGEATEARDRTRGTPRLRYELPDPTLAGPQMERAAERVVRWREALHQTVPTLDPWALDDLRCLEKYRFSRRWNELHERKEAEREAAEKDAAEGADGSSH